MSDAAAPFAGYGTKTYRAYVLGALLVAYTFNFVDRILIGITQEAIKAEFGVSDFMLGLLGGPAFAILYTTLGIPIARYAERANRITIVSIGVAVWSAMTALCGVAANFWQLALARVGVGIGEAACTPPSHSALSDYFPPNRRATALGIYSLGIPIGTMFAAIGGGWLLQNFDWRTTFLLLGAPGLVLALIVKLTVREPPRSGAQQETPGFGEAIRSLMNKPSFWHAAMGGALMSFVGYASAQFLPSYFVRVYHVSPLTAAMAFGAIGGIAVGLGTFLGGFLADRLAHKHKRVITWLPALGVVVAVPLFLLAFLQNDFTIAFALLMIAPIFHYLYLGPIFALAQGVAQPRMRATATALLLLIVNLIGYGLGPPFVGFVADMLTANNLAAAGFAPDDCTDTVNAAVCAGARAEGLRWALGISLVFLIWAAAHFMLAGRTLERDRVS